MPTIKAPLVHAINSATTNDRNQLIEANKMTPTNNNTQSAPQPEARPPAPDWRDHRRPVVLIVEDHDDTREMLQILLQAHGCHVIPAEDGPQALNLAEQSHPDIILMDMKLPVLDGLAVTRIIRAHPVLHEVPIVAVTGMESAQFHRETLAAGCNDCLGKPIDFEHLEKVIRTLTFSATQPAAAQGRSLAVRSKGVISSYRDIH